MDPHSSSSAPGQNFGGNFYPAFELGGGGMMRPNSGYAAQPQYSNVYQQPTHQQPSFGGFGGGPQFSPQGGSRGPSPYPRGGGAPFQPHDFGSQGRGFPHSQIFGGHSVQQQQPPQTFDDWKIRVDPCIQEIVQNLINNGILKPTELDHGCVEEIARSPVQTAMQVLEAFQNQSMNPSASGGPIRNPSAFITKMLKNPGGRGGRGGRGRGEGGRGGRGRGRANDETDYVKQKLGAVMGARFSELDQGALNYLSKQKQEMIDYVADEWQSQQEGVNKPSAWVTKILTAKKANQASDLRQ